VLVSGGEARRALPGGSPARRITSSRHRTDDFCVANARPRVAGLQRRKTVRMTSLSAGIIAKRTP